VVLLPFLQLQGKEGRGENPEVVVPGHVEDGLEPRPEHPHAALEVVPGLDHVPRNDERVDAEPRPVRDLRAGRRPPGPVYRGDLDSPFFAA